jgi:hypothetical protein
VIEREDRDLRSLVVRRVGSLVPTGDPAAYEPDLAKALRIFALRLWNSSSRRGEALAVTEETVQVYRRLAAADPAAHEPDLAQTLNDLNILMAGLGRSQGTVTATEQTVGIRRWWWRSGPPTNPTSPRR